MLFQGEEWAATTPFQYFIDFSEDPDLAKAVSEGRRNEFRHFNWADDVPDPQCQDTFIRSKLNWDEMKDGSHREMLAWYQALLSLRRSLPELADHRLDRVQTFFEDKKEWLIIRRDRLVVVANFAKYPCDIPLDDGDCLSLVLQSNSDVRLHDERIRLPPHSLAVLTPAERFGEPQAALLNAENRSMTQMAD